MNGKVNMESMTFTAEQVLSECIEILELQFKENAAKEAGDILSAVTGIPVLKIRLDADFLQINSSDRAAILQACCRRNSREPIQYIIGKAYFMFDEFAVGEGVLIPRGDTERLVENAIEIWNTEYDRKGRNGEPFRFIEFCTGSGCVAISFVKAAIKNNGSIKGVATDISETALKYAVQNARTLGVDKYIEIIEHDLLGKDFKSLADKYGKFDMIILNPPYIRSDVIGELDPEVLEYEPLIALDGGTDGLEFYRAAADASDALLTNGGYLTAEIGFDQGESVRSVLDERNSFDNIRVIKDHAGHTRVVSARKM